MDESEATGRALVSGLSQDTGSIFKSTGAATERPDTKCQDVVENEDLKNGIRVSQSQPGSNDSRAENAEAVAKGESDVPVDRVYSRLYFVDLRFRNCFANSMTRRRSSEPRADQLDV